MAAFLVTVGLLEIVAGLIAFFYLSAEKGSSSYGLIFLLSGIISGMVFLSLGRLLDYQGRIMEKLGISIKKETQATNKEE